MKPRDILDEMMKEAYSLHNLPFEPPAAPLSNDQAWIIPIRISITESQPNKAVNVISEIVNFKLGDPSFTPKAVASRVRHDLGLGPETERAIEGQIVNGLKLYRKHQGVTGDQRLVHLSIYARKGDEVFLDELDWDLSEPLNTAAQYASSVCEDLNLDRAWFDTICSYVQGRLDELNEDLLARPHIVELLPPVTKAQREEPVPADFPRMDAYDPNKDGEAERARARMRAMRAKPAAK